MKVNKDQFDALLGKLMQGPPLEGKMIKGQPGKLGPIVPAIQQSTPRKA